MSSHHGDNSSEYEETLVMVNFEDFDCSKFLFDSEKINLKDVYGSQPHADVDGFGFKGKYETNLGSMMFFKKRQKDDSSADVDIEYVGMTSKKLKMTLTSIPVVGNSTQKK
jgi:hypothetical protein